MTWRSSSPPLVEKRRPFPAKKRREKEASIVDRFNIHTPAILYTYFI
jgi:hypothetical protein